MAQHQTSGNFIAFSPANWRQLMRLVDFVSILIDHDEKRLDGDLIKGQAEVGDRLFSMIEELSVDCIQRGMGREVALALQRLSTPAPAHARTRAAQPCAHDSTSDTSRHGACAPAATQTRVPDAE
ncbi:MAG: hypothetical protein O2826_11460 [Chloroflexi bacterium]|nr:hypothetical protein [Chloroflexota bacterium]MDA1175117.1 hypothetical protein [Chloroflexota bacterium]